MALAGRRLLRTYFGEIEALGRGRGLRRVRRVRQSRKSPDITDFVNELLDTGRYRMFQVAGTLAVILNLPTAMPLDDIPSVRTSQGSLNSRRRAR